MISYCIRKEVRIVTSIQEQCKALRLSQIPSVYLEIPFEDREQYLSMLLTAEIEAKNNKKANNLLKRASFPSHKSLEGFEWEHIQLPTHASITDITELLFL